MSRWSGRAAVPVAPPDTEADRLLTTLLATLAKVEAVLTAWSLTRTDQRTPRETGLSDGLLEVHSRLTQGLPKEWRP